MRLFKRYDLLTCLVVYGFLSGCASTNPRPAFDDVRQRIVNRTGMETSWGREAEETAEIRAAVSSLLNEELTGETAVHIALLNNRSLLASFEEIGISQADLAQASRIGNPSFHGSLRFGEPSDNTELGFALNVLDIFILPLKKKVAAVELERTKLRVAHEVISVAADVKRAFYEYLASRQLLSRLEVNEQIRSAAAELAVQQEAAGNLSELDLAQHRALYNQIRVAVAKAQVSVRMRRETLNRLLGLWGNQIDWRAKDRLPPLPQTDPSLESVEKMAIENRFDLGAARKGVEQVERALSLKRRTRFLPGGVEIGVESEKEPDGERVTGPSLGLKLPIFDQGQPAVARLESQLRQSRHRLEGLSIQIRSEVRQQRDFLLAARELTEHYRDTLIPARREIVELTLQQANMMLAGTYDLLAAREREVETERAYVEVWRDYWIAYVELERALGGGFKPVGGMGENLSLPQGES